jgi:acetyltransferase-like isoleucine patch superfamily enzyme
MAGFKGFDIAKEKLTDELYKTSGGALAAYKKKVIGAEAGILDLFLYELFALFCANLGGGAGYLLRKITAARLFKQCGSKVILGRGLTLRKPKYITIGSNTALDDYVMLDACIGKDNAITIGDNVIISKGCVVQAKTGTLSIGAKCDIGVDTIITSASSITLEQSVLIAGNCYIGGARYHLEDKNRAIMEQGTYSRGPISIGEGSWIGASSTILDGVRIGKGCVIGAGSVVSRDIPDYAIAVGTPARVIKTRK